MSDPAPTTPPSPRRISTRAFTIGALIACLVIACVISVFASSSPDGLEFVAGTSGFLDTADDSVTAGSPLADYAATGVTHSWLSVAIAGAIGCAVTFGIAWAVGAMAKRRRAAA